MRVLAFAALCGAAWAAPRGVWLDVPFFPQERNGCGAASIAMIMRYWQAPADPREIQRQLYAPEASGIYASQMERYLKEHGFRVFAMRGGWEDLRHHLEKGRPLIVALEPGGGARHYVVVAGMEADAVLKNDPGERKLLKQVRSEFEKQWKAAGHWMLLAVPSR